MRAWSASHGVNTDPRFLPWLQLGPIPWKMYPFLGMACSLMKQPAVVPVPPHELLPQMPAWHSSLFRDTHKNTYYSPSLISGGGQQHQSTAGGHITERLPAAHMDPVYTLGLQAMTQPAERPATPPPKETSPIFWMEWNTRHKLRFLSSLTPEPPRQGTQVWKAWDKLVSMQKALWKRHPTGELAAQGNPMPAGRPAGNQRTRAVLMQVYPSGGTHSTPPPQIGEEMPTNRRTNWRTNFSAKQAPSALDLSPRPQTHLPYGCSIVAVMWKRKMSLNVRKKIFVSRSLHGP